MYTVAFTVLTGTPVLTQLGAPQVDLYGALASNTASGAEYFLKLWWQGNSLSTPVIGTTTPSLTIPVGYNPITTAGIEVSWMRPLNMGGPCWYAVTLNAAPNDDTAIATGGDVVTLLLE